MSEVVVCVPTYNKAKSLKEGLESLLRQSFKDFQLYIVDDGSTDGTEAVVRSFGDERIVYVRNSRNLGLSGNWNRCVELALESGAPYVGIFHDDDLYDPALLDREVTFLNKEGRTAFVYPSMIHLIMADGRKNLIQLYRQDRVMTAIEAMDDLCFRSKYYVSSPALLARRSAYLRAGKFDGRYKYTPDYDLWWRMAEHGDIGYIAAPLLTQRIHPAELSASRAAFEDATSQAELLAILTEALSRIRARAPELDAEARTQGIKRYCAKHCLLAGKIALEWGEYGLAGKAVGRARELSSDWTIRSGAALFYVFNGEMGRTALSLSLQADRLARRTLGLRLWPQDLFMIS